MNSRVIIYTVSLGGLLPVEPPEYRDPAARYLAFTDGRCSVGAGWENLSCPTRPVPTPRRSSRKPKMLPFEFLPECDVAVYVDAHLSPALPARAYAGLVGEADVATYKHARRNTVYEHSRDLIEQGLADPRAVTACMRYLRSVGANSNALLRECSLIVWRNTAKARRCGKLWDAAYASTSCERDQLTFPVAVNQSGAVWREIPGSYFTPGPTVLKHVKGPKSATRKKGRTA